MKMYPHKVPSHLLFFNVALEVVTWIDIQSYGHLNISKDSGMEMVLTFAIRPGLVISNLTTGCTDTR